MLCAVAGGTAKIAKMKAQIRWHHIQRKYVYTVYTHTNRYTNTSAQRIVHNIFKAKPFLCRLSNTLTVTEMEWDISGDGTEGVMCERGMGLSGINEVGNLRFVCLYMEKPAIMD